MNLRNMIAAFVTVAILIALPGCLAVAAVAGVTAAVAYSNGELEGKIDGSVSQVVAAAVATLEENDLPVLTNVASDVEGTVTSMSDDGERITIKVTRSGRDACEVGIRVGPYGDEDLSRTLFRGMRDRVE